MGKKAILSICIFICVFTANLNPVFSLRNDDAYSYPLKNPKIVNNFVKPETKYSSGHRGIDFFALKSTPVYAIADGQVIFAGRVAGALHVTVLHVGEIKSTYTFLLTKSVNVGENISKGQLVGTASGTNATGDTNVFMLTMRLKNEYVDPLLYLNERKVVKEIYLEKISDDSFIEEVISESKYLKDYFGLKAKFKNVNDIEKLIHNAVNAVKNIHNSLSQEEAYKQIVRALKETKKYVDLYIAGYKKAMKYGIDSAKYYLESTKDILILLQKYQIDIAVAINDWIKSTYNTSTKVLKQYVDVDLLMLLRELALPISCLSNACSVPVKMKCDPKSNFKIRGSNKYRGSGNSVMFVSGINAKGKSFVAPDNDGSGKKSSAPVNFPWKKLGYEKQEVNYYSYSSYNEEYKPSETFQDLYVSAAKMDEQIKIFKQKTPDKKLDLITHSQGGAITALWLAKYYDTKSDLYPELGKIIMYAPPLSGTALSTAGSLIDSTQTGKNIHELLSRAIAEIPSPDATSIRQLKENGEIAAELSDADIFEKVNVQVIRASSDLIVSSASDPINGVDETIVDTDKKGWLGNLDAINAHSDITTDEKTTVIAQHILEGTRAPCVPISESLSSVFKSSRNHALEVFIGRVSADTFDSELGENTRQYLDSFN
ncbi:MAG: peptidoglycan DD-metalloendopeptidase family protein [Acidimicrobiia bacterium]